MDAKVTLSFNKEVIEKAKRYAEKHNMSLSRLMELILSNITTNQYASLEDLPVSDWVSMLSEGETEYTKTKSRSQIKSEYRSRKK